MTIIMVTVSKVLLTYNESVWNKINVKIIPTRNESTRTSILLRTSYFDLVYICCCLSDLVNT
jgi:hypothetical protein